MMYSVHRSVLIALGISLPLTAIAAQTDDDALREVIVTARSLEVTTPLELSRYGNDVTFVSSEEMKNHGFVDVTQGLEMLVPGAYVATQAGAFSYVNLSLQGSRTADVLWTVDGVRINNRLYNGTSPSDTLPASMIERMEILKAGQGLLYGTQAAAGVINIVTRAFSDTPDGEISAGADSRNGMHVNGYARGAVGKHHFVGWASKDESDGYWLYDALQPNATTRKRRYDVASFGLKYGFDFTDSTRLTLQGVHTEAALDYPNLSNTNVNDRSEDVLSARLDLTPSEQVELYLKGYVHKWDTDYYPSTDRSDTAYWGYRDAGASAAAKLALSKNFEYHVGYDFQRYHGRDEVLRIDGLKETAQAVYAQIRSTDDLSASTRFTAGLRYNHTGGADATVWSVSGIHEFSKALYVETVIGTSFLLPDAYQLYGIEPDDTRGNPNLEPEKSLGINLAIGGNFELASRPLHWQLTGWQRRINNLIMEDDSNPPEGFSGLFVNVDEEVKVSGGELLLKGDLTDTLSFDSSYTYSRELAQGTGQQLADRPRHSGKLGLRYQAGSGRGGLDLALKYFGTTSTTSLAGFGVQRYGGDVIANLGAHWFLDGNHRHRIGARIENLFDTAYVTRIRSAAVTGSSPPVRFMYRNLGVPRTGYLNYSYHF
ncbi:MAG: TonB-dependent receptor [Steroidobacteraceae bacterium]